METGQHTGGSGPRVHPPRTRPEVGDPLCSDAGGAEPCLGPPGCRRGQPWPAGTPSTKHPPPRVGPPTWHRRGRQGGSGTSSRPALAQGLDGRCRVHGGALHQLRSPPSFSSVGTFTAAPAHVDPDPPFVLHEAEKKAPRSATSCRRRAKASSTTVGMPASRKASRAGGGGGSGAGGGTSHRHPRSRISAVVEPRRSCGGPGRPAQGRFIAFVNYYRKGTASQGYSSAEVVETRTVHLLIA